VAIAFFYSPELQFIGREGNVLQRWQHPDGIGQPRVNENSPSPDFDVDRSDLGFLRIAASERTIVSVYCGCLGSARDSTDLRLVVHSWDGTYIGEARVPYYISALAVASDGKRVFL